MYFVTAEWGDVMTTPVQYPRTPCHSSPAHALIKPSPSGSVVMMHADCFQESVGAEPPPLFDVPEIPSLRRVAPLPKRRRTTIDLPLAEATPAPESERTSTPTPDELATTLSTSMALQTQAQSQSTYYMPLFKGSVPAPVGRKSGPRGPGPRLAMFKDDIDARHVNPDDIVKHEAFYAYASRSEREDGDYADHLRQPGNTKKRKVPVAPLGAICDDLSLSTGDHDELTDSRSYRELEERSAAMEALNALTVPATPAPICVAKRSRLTRAARAALQHKEIIKSRKKQLAIFLGALSQDDSLALDAALYDYPLAKEREAHEAQSPPVRLSRRLERRRTRALVSAMKALPANEVNENTKVPECSFTFEHESATSERVMALQDEVAFLHERIKSEWSRQMKMAEIARRAHRTVKDMQKELKKQEQRAKLAERLMNEMPLSEIEKVTATKVKSKKKKRSALANASNPHHLRNYVPSRLPNSSANRPTQTAAGSDPLNALPLRFLSAQLPPREHKSGVVPSASLANPEEEWICPFCEYNIFYGDERSYRRAVRQRKKILSRRRRALERAAATASGRTKGVASPAAENEDPAADDLTDGFDASSPELQTLPKRGKHPTRGEQDRDRDKEEGIAR